MKNCGLVALLIGVGVLYALGGVAAENKMECFETSLHHTTRGMAHWYDAQDGFSAVTKVPYKELGCKGCHVSSCEDCHLEDTGDGCCDYSLDKARDPATCLKCHSREKATIGIDKARGTPGVHMSFLGCADCHTAREVHGDGTCYESMRAPGAMDAKCTNCHGSTEGDYAKIPDTDSHMVHGDALDCSACHVSNTMTCYNCHFGVLKETGKKPESFAAKVKDFLLLVKYNGKITSGTMQTLVGVDNYPFITYVPYLTHSVTAQGRTCEQCHDTEPVNALAAGERFTPAVFQDGALSFYKGVIPVVPQQLDWPFLEKKHGQWVPFTPKDDPLIQMGVYAEPLSSEELDMMSSPQGY